MVALKGRPEPTVMTLEKSPVVRDCVQHIVVEVEGPGFSNGCGQETMPLVSHAESALQRDSIGVLHVSRAPDDQCVLSVVDGFRKCVADAEVHPMVDLPFQRNSHAVVHAVRFALKGINCS